MKTIPMTTSFRHSLVGAMRRLALIAPVLAVLAIFAKVRGFDVAAKMAAVDFRNLALATYDPALEFFGHRFAHFVAEHESRFVGQAQVAAHGEHGLALDLIAEDRDREKIGAQRQLMKREQRSAGD